MINSLYIFLSVFLVSLISFIGVLILSFGKRLNHVLIYFVSFSTGSLLGSAFFHLLPHALEEKSFNLKISFYLLAGLIFCFILEKFISWRHCHIVPSKDHPHPFSFLILIGDGFHNFLDGLIIAASYSVNLSLGFSTTLAIIFHEIPQEFGDFASLIYAGFNKSKAIFFNFLSSFMAILGAASFLIFIHQFAESLIHFLIPFAAGNFIYIASSDLIPQLHKEIELKKSIFQLFFLLMGLLIMTILI